MAKPLPYRIDRHNGTHADFATFEAALLAYDSTSMRISNLDRIGDEFDTGLTEDEWEGWQGRDLECHPGAAAE